MSTGLGRSEASPGLESGRPLDGGVSAPAPASAADTPGTPGTPGTPDSSSEDMLATSTLTTTVTRDGKDLRGRTDRDEKEVTSTTQITHLGAKGLTHQVDKDGAVHLRPIRASVKSRKKVRALVSFVPRQSHFDRFNITSSKDPFRGFYTLFWIGLLLLMLNTFYTSFEKSGQIVSLTFATLFSKDARVLALSDAVLVGSLFACVPFAKVLKRGWVRYWPTAVVFQHLYQTVLLFAVIRWTRYREWPWVQSGFFVLHTLAMMMKIHSYMATNGNMADAYHKMRRIEGMLEERVAEIEGPGEAGWSRALDKAREEDLPAQRETALAAKEEVEAFKGQNGNSKAGWNSLEAQRGTSELRHRANANVVTRSADAHEYGAEHKQEPAKKGEAQQKEAARAEKDAKGQAEEKENENSENKGTAATPSPIRDPHPLATHPESMISTLAREIETLREDLLSPGHDGDTSKRVMWPENVTYWNFFDYLLVPTLVYELEYPRTKSIRPLYVLEKTLATFGTFFVIYVITEHWIMPIQPTPNTPFLRAFVQLALPMMINYLLIFYIMFECICNAFAELTRFADREFYLDWWNATSMDVFSRKWNKPVHNFLLRHVYASTIAAWGLSRTTAMFLTFLLSSLVHELVMAIVSGKIRGYLFAAQMAQIPLIALGQIPFIRRNETLGNLTFWIGILCGFPLLNILYLIY